MTKTYTRRSPEQIIKDLEAKIEKVKQRAAAKEAAADVKGSPEGGKFLAAVKAVDRALLVAGEQKNEAMVRALEAARAPLGEHLVSMGVRLPERRRKAS